MPKKKKELTEEAVQAFEAAMERVHNVFGVKTQVQLAERLDVRQSSISDAKRRCSIPSDWLLKIWRQTGYSPDWIMDGDDCGHRFAVTSTEAHEPVNACDIREEIEADVRREMDNLHLEDLLDRIHAIRPNAVITFPPVEAARGDVSVTETLN